MINTSKTSALAKPFHRDNVEPLYAISTANIPKTWWDAFDAPAETVVMYPLQYGGLLWVPTSDDWKEWLRELDEQAFELFSPVINWARDHGLVWVKFDSSAPEVADLPVFDHEDEVQVGSPVAPAG